MLTVACVFMQGSPYTADDIVRIARGVRMSVGRPCEFVCLTDRPNDVMIAGQDDDIGVIRIASGVEGLAWIAQQPVVFQMAVFDPIQGES